MIETEQRSTGEGHVQAWLAGASRQGTFAVSESSIDVPESFAAKWNSHATGGSFPMYTAISRAPGATGSAKASSAQVRTIASLRLERLVNEERLASQIDDDCVDYADAAVRDALTLVGRSNLSGAENVFVSEDGILSIQWRRGGFGVVMVFAGDGTAAISTAAPGKLYSQSPTRFPIIDGIPLGFLIALQQLLA
jgi:hypothetical protein